MKTGVKRKVNLTVNADLFQLAKQVAEIRGRSLSGLVEEFLSELVRQGGQPGEDWLAAFHAKYLPKHHREPSDRKMDRLRAGLIEKHE